MGVNNGLTTSNPCLPTPPLDSGFRRNDGVMQKSPPGEGVILAPPVEVM